MTLTLLNIRSCYQALKARCYKVQVLIGAVLLFSSTTPAVAQPDGLQLYTADHAYIQYTGRIDFTDPKRPRFWQPGVYVSMKFRGNRCELILQDEILWGSFHNYIEIIIDGKASRMQTKYMLDTIRVSADNSVKEHELILVKNTEANIGYLSLVGVRCQQLVMPAAKPVRKIEFIGNSITCGAGSDASVVPCGKGVWQDQHNAYLSYGAVTARNLNAQYHLSAVSGIGLMHSCCNMDVTMPQVFDKINMRNDTINWDFSRYQPDVVTICLGQNDGIQDSAAFASQYIIFLKKLRGYYPKASFICLSSPMADASLLAFTRKMLPAIVSMTKASGDKKVSYYFFSKRYNKGCDGHPDLEEHEEIAKELSAIIKQKMAMGAKRIARQSNRLKN